VSVCAVTRHVFVSLFVIVLLVTLFMSDMTLGGAKVT
jgi:hypothetical protein